MVSVYLRSLGKLKKLKFDADFSKISIKGRSSGGNILTKNSIKKIEFKSEGFSTLEARKIWFDSTINRLNVDNRGLLLGDFQSEDKLLTINKKGEIQITSTDLSTHFDDSIIIIEKLIHKKPISAIYYNGDKQSYFIKRFITNEISNGKFSFIGMHKNSELLLVSTDYRPVAEVIFNKEKGKDRKSQIINIEKFISIKGWKSLGNKLTNKKIKEIKWLESLPNDLINEVNNSEESTKNVGQNKIDKELIKNDALKNKPNVSDEGAQQISLDL